MCSCDGVFAQRLGRKERGKSIKEEGKIAAEKERVSPLLGETMEEGWLYFFRFRPAVSPNSHIKGIGTGPEAQESGALTRERFAGMVSVSFRVQKDPYLCQKNSSSLKGSRNKCFCIRKTNLYSQNIEHTITFLFYLHV